MCRSVSLWSLCPLLACAMGGNVFAQAGPRQYYSADASLANKDTWFVDRQNGFAATYYCFKSDPDDVGYKRHKVYYLFKDPTHIYFQNEATKEYWGRCV